MQDFGQLGAYNKFNHNGLHSVRLVSGKYSSIDSFKWF